MKISRIFTIICFIAAGLLVLLNHSYAYPYHNLAQLQSVGASSSAPNHPPAFAVDGDDDTFWKTVEGDNSSWFVVYLDSACIIDQIVLPYFSGIGMLKIEVHTRSVWREVFNGNTDQQVLFGFQPVITNKLRLIFDNSEPVSINEIQIFAHNPQPIFVNQSGYNLHGPKRFTAPKAADGSTFVIKRVTDGKLLYQGNIFGHIGDFSDFTPEDTGPYRVEVESDDKLGSSMPFNIGAYWIEKVSYQKAVDFMLDSRCWWGDARNYTPTDSETFCTRGVAWRDGVQYSFEVSSLIMLYLSNPGAFTVERMPIQGPYQGLRHQLTEDAPEILRLIYWGVDIYLRAQVDDALLKEQLAYFVYAYPYFSDYIPRVVYEEALEYLFKIWGKQETERFENSDFGMSEFYSATYSSNLFSTYELVGTGKGHFPPCHSIIPNLMMYEVAKREKLPEVKKFFQAAYNQAEWIIQNLDWSDPKVTKGQRQGEWITVTSLAYFMSQYPQRAPKGLKDKIQSWADVVISRSDNMWDFRKYSEERWIIPNIRPPEDPSHAIKTGFNEPGNVAGLPGPLLAAALLIDDPLTANRLRQLAFSHIDNMFGRNPTGRHYCYDGVADFEGVELGWFKEYQGGAGQLQSVRGVLDGSPKETTYPFDPYAGDPGHTEGWVTFNTPWNASLAYLSHFESDLEIYDSTLLQPVQTVSLSDSHNRFSVILKAPLNFNYEKSESGEIMVKTSRGDHLLLTVTEKNLNSTDFVGRLVMEEGEVNENDDSIQVRPGDIITISYGWDVFQRSVSMNIIR